MKKKNRDIIYQYLYMVLNSKTIQNIIHNIALVYKQKTDVLLVTQKRTIMFENISKLFFKLDANKLMPLYNLKTILDQQTTSQFTYQSILSANSQLTVPGTLSQNKIVFKPVLFVDNQYMADFAHMIKQPSNINALFIFNENYDTYNSYGDTTIPIHSYKCTYRAWGLPTGLLVSGLWTNMDIKINDPSKPNIHNKTPNQIIDEAIDDILRIIKLRSGTDNPVYTIYYYSEDNKQKLPNDPKLPYIGLNTFLSTKTAAQPGQDILCKYLTEKLSEIPKKLFEKWYKIDIFDIPNLTEITPFILNAENPSVQNLNKLQHSFQKDFKENFVKTPGAAPIPAPPGAPVPGPAPGAPGPAPGSHLIPLSCTAVAVA